MQLARFVPKQNQIYQACLTAARRSPCKKKKVGAVLVAGGEIIDADCNRTIEEIREVCEPECIRMQFPACDRSIAACAHAEERLLWRYMGNATRTHRMNTHLYVASLNADGTPERLRHHGLSCMRCARAVYFSGIATVRTVYLGYAWAMQTPDEALKSSMTRELERFR